MRILFAASTNICALLGIAHLGFGFVTYRQLSPEAVWFAGTGMALVLFAAPNWATLAVPTPRLHVRRMVLALDVLMVAFGVVVVRAVPEPQAYVLLATFIGIGFSGLFTSQQHERATASTTELPNER